MSFNIKQITFNKKYLGKEGELSFCSLLNVKCYLLFLLSVICYLLSSPPVFAQVDIKTQFGSPFTDLGSLISTLLPNIFIIAGVIFFVLLIFGGLSFIINAGKGESEAAGKGKNMITWAIIGFILIFASIWIIQIVGFITGIDFLKPKL